MRKICFTKEIIDIEYDPGLQQSWSVYKKKKKKTFSLSIRRDFVDETETNVEEQTTFVIIVLKNVNVYLDPIENKRKRKEDLSSANW